MNWYCKICNVENHPARTTCWKCLKAKSNVAIERGDKIKDHFDNPHELSLEQVCGNCRAKIPPGNKYCGNCGIVLKGNSYDRVQNDRSQIVLNKTPLITDFGRWICPLCGSINGPARNDCYKCNWKYKSTNNNSNSSSSTLEYGRWECPECHSINGPARTACYKCGKTISTHVVDSTYLEDKNEAHVSSGIKSSNAALTGVGGWLMLLVIAMIVIKPLVDIAVTSTGIKEAEIQYPYLASLGDWNSFKTILWMTVTITSAMSIYGGWGLIKGRDWSVVRRAQIILWLVNPIAMIIAGFLVPYMIFGVNEPIDSDFIQEILRSVIVVSIWTIYLSVSKRVRNTYGKPKHLN